MNLGLNGKRALVLGGNKGLGRGIAEALAAEGVIVAVAARDKHMLDETAAALTAPGQPATGFQVDLGDENSVTRLLEQLETDFGPIDIVVLNGGGPPPSMAGDFDAKLWREQFQAMVLSAMRITISVLPGMRARAWGRVLIVGSTSVREPIGGLTVSNALRSAMAGWAKTLAGEVAADGVTVNMLLPGRLLTDRTRRFDAMDAAERGVGAEVIAAESQAQIPAGRYGTPAEFGAVAAFLASNAAAYVTGTAIPVDGGLSQSML